MYTMQALTAIMDELLKLLECPVCFQKMAAPIETCKNGHNVCHDCRTKIYNCPSCKSEFAGIRNLLAESFADKLPFPCVNAEVGCSVNVLRKDLAAHSTRCPFRIYNCLRLETHGCPWTGRRSEILRHFEDKHKENIIRGDTMKLSLLPSGKNINPPHLICAHDEIFCYISNLNKDKATKTRYVQFIGPEEKASEFIFQFELQSEDELHKVMFSTTTQSDLKTKEDIIRSGECIESSIAMFNKYFLNHGLKIQIIKIVP